MDRLKNGTGRPVLSFALSVSGINVSFVDIIGFTVSEIAFLSGLLCTLLRGREPSEDFKYFLFNVNSCFWVKTITVTIVQQKISNISFFDIRNLVQNLVTTIYVMAGFSVKVKRIQYKKILGNYNIQSVCKIKRSSKIKVFLKKIKMTKLLLTKCL